MNAMGFDSWRQSQTPIDYLDLIYEATTFDADFHCHLGSCTGCPLLRALQWFDVGADLLGKGIILLPFAGVIAFAGDKA